MNNDLISREGLKKVFNGYHSGIGSQPKFTLGACLQLIDNAPTVEPEKVLVANVTFDEDKLEQLVRDKVIEPIKNGELVLQTDTRTHENWIPVTYRPMTKEEEKEFCEKWGVKELEDWEKRAFTCPLPEEGQEILISTYWGVSEDVCTWDDGCIGLEDRGDWDGVDAWMPKPEPYKKEGEKDG